MRNAETAVLDRIGDTLGCARVSTADQDLAGQGGVVAKAGIAASEPETVRIPSVAPGLEVAVAPARVSPSAHAKARSKRTTADGPVHSFQTLLDDLATIARNRIVPHLPDAKPLDVLTRPTALQREVFRLLGVRLDCTQ